MDEDHFYDMEEEAYFYHTIGDFEQLIEIYGVDLVVDNMNASSRKKLRNALERRRESYRVGRCFLLSSR